MSGSKRQNVKRMGLPVPVTGGAGQPLATATPPPAPPPPTAPAPFGLFLIASGYERSGPSPSAYAQIGWFAGAGTPVSASWELEWSRSADFSQTPIKKATTNPGEIRGLAPGTTSVRVRAVINGLPGHWSTALAVTISALSDAPPQAPTDLAVLWSPLTGDVTIRCTKPAGEQILGVQFRILTALGGTSLRTSPVTQGEYLWPREQQRADRGGSLPLPASASCFIIANAMSWAGNLSSDVTLAASLAAPTTPTGLTTSWASDPGTAGPTCRISWTALATVPVYDVTVDSVLQPEVVGGSYDYPLARNAQDHGSPDPVLSVSVRARDALGQTSAAASLTATNTAPPATTIVVFSGRFVIGLTIGASAAADLKDYRVRVYKGGPLVRTLFVTDLKPVYTPEDGNGIYTFDVAARDVFGQVGPASSQTTGVDLIDPAQFVADLRAGLIYTDSAGTAQATLAGLKDADLTTNVVTYGSSTPWRWIQADWQEEITTQIVELALSATASIYLGYSIDGTSWTWMYGGTPAAGRYTPASSTTTEATAQGGAVSLPAGNWRIKLTTPRRARYIRLGHRHTSASYALREFFPATLVRATYIEAENLAAISADLGSITAGTITGVIMTGSTVQTAASGQRVVMDSTGLRTYDSAGNVVIEATTATNGALLAGVGAVRLDRSGLILAADTVTIDPTLPGAVKWYNGAAFVGGITGYAIGGSDGMYMQATRQLQLFGIGPGVNDDTELALIGGTSRALAVRIGWSSRLSVTEGGTSVSGGLNLGTAAGAAAGDLYASRRARIGINAPAPGDAVLSVGDSAREYNPVGSDWMNQSTLLLTGATYTTIGFHDSGNRVDYIRAGGGRITLGYNGGYGTAEVQMDGVIGIRTAPVAQQALRILSTGNTSSDYPLAVLNASSGNLLLVRGDAVFQIAGTWQNISDARVKTDLAGLAPDEALDQVLAWAPVSYRYSDGRADQTRHVGLIAQQLQLISPDLVREGEAGLLTIAYTEAIPILAACIQALWSRLTRLERA